VVFVDIFQGFLPSRKQEHLSIFCEAFPGFLQVSGFVRYRLSSALDGVESILYPDPHAILSLHREIAAHIIGSDIAYTSPFLLYDIGRRGREEIFLLSFKETLKILLVTESSGKFF
jgi:hypothetical protein